MSDKTPLDEKFLQEEYHDVYKELEEEVINVRMRVKDYRVLMKIIERDRVMTTAWKWILGFLGAFITLASAIQLGLLKKLGVS